MCRSGSPIRTCTSCVLLQTVGCDADGATATSRPRKPRAHGFQREFRDIPAGIQGRLRDWGMPRSAGMLYLYPGAETPNPANGGHVGISYVEFEDEAGILRRYRKHVNGRGLVATTAKVDATAFVDPTAYVDPGAEVQRGATISHGAWVEADAIVAEKATIGVNARIGRGAVIGRFAVVGPYAAVGAGARVQNGARVPREAHVAEGGEHRASGDDLRRLGLAA